MRDCVAVFVLVVCSIASGDGWWFVVLPLVMVCGLCVREKQWYVVLHERLDEFRVSRVLVGLFLYIGMDRRKYIR